MDEIRLKEEDDEVQIKEAPELEQADIDFDHM